MLNFRNVLSIDEYASFFKNIDPLAQYKKWIDKQAVGHDKVTLRQDPCSERVQAVFVVSDSIDWSRDIQAYSSYYISLHTTFASFIFDLFICQTFTLKLDFRRHS